MNPDHARYLRSEEWRERRRACLKRDGYRCQVCGCTTWQRVIDAHHLHYRNMFRELPEDLISLCQVHHTMAHNQPGGYDRPVIERLRDECDRTYWTFPLPPEVEQGEAAWDGRMAAMECQACGFRNALNTAFPCCYGCGTSLVKPSPCEQCNGVGRYRFANEMIPCEVCFAG